MTEREKSLWVYGAAALIGLLALLLLATVAGCQWATVEELYQRTPVESRTVGPGVQDLHQREDTAGPPGPSYTPLDYRLQAPLPPHLWEDSL